MLFFFVAHGIYVFATGMSKRGELDQMSSILLGFNNYPMRRSYPAPEGMQHLWSLSIEWQFYLVAPILIGLLLRRVSDRVTMTVITSLIVAIVCWRLLLHSHRVSDIFLYVRTDTRADAMLAGVLLAYWRRNFRVSKRWAAALGWLGIAILIWGVTELSFLRFYFYEPIIIAASGMLLISAIAGSGPNQLFNWKPLLLLGKVSYAIYLWHLFIFLVINHYWQHWHIMTKALVGLAATALVAAVSWFTVEKPIQRWQKQLRKAWRVQPVIAMSAL